MNLLLSHSTLEVSLNCMLYGGNHIILPLLLPDTLLSDVLTSVNKSPIPTSTGGKSCILSDHAKFSIENMNVFGSATTNSSLSKSEL
jgi:hypothetical protein